MDGRRRRRRRIGVRSQGFHAEHLLIVVEEFPGMDPSIVTALKNTATAPHNIIFVIGNPDNQLDPLHQFSELPAVEAIRISAYDHPNVVTGNASLVPGATSRGFIAEKLAEYGESGPLFLSRVRGQSLKEAFNGLFRQADLEAAAERWNAIMGKTPLGVPYPVDRELRSRFLAGTKALGCDPANTPNGDRFALSHWQGAVMTTLEKLACQDATEFGEEIAQIATTNRIAAQNIGVDGVGVGAATVNYLRRKLTNGMRLRVLLGGSEESREGFERTDEITKEARTGFQLTANRFYNLRAQMAWEFSQKLRRGTVAIPKHPQLWRGVARHPVLDRERRGEVGKESGDCQAAGLLARLCRRRHVWRLRARSTADGRDGY